MRRNLMRVCKQCGREFEGGRHLSPNRNQFHDTACRDAYWSAHPRTLLELWSRHVARGEGCWEWTAYRDPKGYGRMTGRKGHDSLAHRISWILHYGPIPDGLDVCHHCDNPPCVRPDHLFLGDARINMQDASQKGRTTIGERGPAAKLTADKARTILDRYAAGGISQQALAREYGLAQATISELIRRLTWKFV